VAIAFARLRNRIISPLSLAIAFTVEANTDRSFRIYLLEKYMSTQDLILLVVLLCPGLLLSVTIMLTFAAGG
jgi:hypothetical protein